MKALVASLVLLLGPTGGPFALAQDLLGVGEIEGLPGQTRNVPVTIRDVSGTLLDEGDGFDVEIQGFAFRVDFAPAQHVSAVTFVQAGVTAAHTAVFPVIIVNPDHVIVLLSFDETTDPLAFTLDAPAPGNLVGLLRFTLSAGAPLGTLIGLTLDPTSATLVNHSATLSETLANGHLAIDDGWLLLDDAILSDGFESGDFSGWSSVVGG